MHTKEQIESIESTTGWRSEDQMQAAYFQWAHNTYPQLRGVLFSVPNGGSRNRIEALKFKATGMTAGIPDLLCVYRNRIVGIEFKLPKGVLSPDQKKIHEIWVQNGVEIYTVRTFELWKQIIENIVKL